MPPRRLTASSGFSATAMISAISSQRHAGLHRTDCDLERLRIDGTQYATFAVEGLQANDVAGFGIAPAVSNFALGFGLRRRSCA